MSELKENSGLKFKEIEEPVFTTDVYYDLFNGGYIDPHELLEDKKQADIVVGAMKVVESFIEGAVEQEVVELG